MCELLSHPFIKQVNFYADEVSRAGFSLRLRFRLQLKQRLRQVMCKFEKTRRRTKPPETTKHGLLKTDRKARHQPILIEDLATLEDLNEQLVVETLSKRFMR